MARLTVLALALLALATPAFADGPEAAERPADKTIDGAIVAGALAASLAPMAIPLRHHALWDDQMFGPIDETVYQQFSQRAARMSDFLLAASIAAPAAYLTGSTVEDAAGDRLVLYGEALAVDLALVQVAKYLVQRPRPYLYNQSHDAVRFAAAAGDDGWASFYSSHAAMSFGAAVAGAYLFSTSSTHPLARAAAWASGFATAAATANLRVRAGRHFYSDILFGALAGTAVGYAVPALHARGKPYVPGSNEIAAAAAGLFGGVIVSQLIPVGDPIDTDRIESIARSARSGAAHLLMFDQVRLAPLAVADGAGLAISGRVRSRSWGRVPLSPRRSTASTADTEAGRDEPQAITAARDAPPTVR